MKPQAALFDLDGLMLDTERPFLTRLGEAARRDGWNLTDELLSQTIGIDLYATEALLKRALGASFPFMELRAEVLKLEEALYEREGIGRRPGLIALLDALAEKKIPAAVATSTYRERAMWKLKCGGIDGRFAATVCGDEITNGKPAPDIFLLAAKKLGTAPADCIGLEDSPAGIRSLSAAGIRSIFVKDLVEPDAEISALIWKRLADLNEAIALF